MNTTIALVYFTETLNNDRKHHEVNDSMLRKWLYFYEKSATTMKPCLLLDSNTSVPNFWKYQSIMLNDSEPPDRKDILNKVGFMKAQSYEVLGRSIVMDIDCMIINCLDELDSLVCPIAMAVDSSRRTYEKWPEVGEELNAGVMLFDSPIIFTKFKELWKSKQNFIHITYFDELIFSAICREFNGKILDERWNASWPINETDKIYSLYSNLSTKIIHFHGKRKDQLDKFYKNIRIKF